ncbi:phytanoyl-CoA dioxygenase domain-containing protein 1-like [Lineus longissimus]|uniref:phytanoyl-CoA dioxygenase domain-containing protein 1-like n=1 Tax=Lineus longissimus TaxID=88925 RepID=UPI00315DAE26
MAFSMTELQARKFEDDGYLIIEDFLSADEVVTLEKTLASIIDEMDPEKENKMAFSTNTEKVENDNDYFINSADKIRFFFEKGALDERGNLQVDKSRSLNKIGHALHVLNPEFKRVTFSDRVKNIARKMEFKNPAVIQSMAIFKQPGIGGEVTNHQDASFLHNEPIKLMGYWIALEDATLENGCLWFIPGSHKEGLGNNRRMVRNEDKKPGEPYLVFTAPIKEWDQKAFVPGPVKKGSLVLIDGLIAHRSNTNTSDKSRHIYTFHIIEMLDSKYDKLNWLQPTEVMPFPMLFDFA